MKIRKIFSFSLLFVAHLAISQSGRLAGTSLSPCIEEHLNFVEAMRKDTSYHASLTPETPTCGDEKSAIVQYFPYPIIFLHGLKGSADTWFEFYDYALSQGWSYGGHLKYNLNYDQNFSSSKIVSDVHDFNGNLQPADFYLMNFNVMADGTSNGSSPATDATLSNQSAITKQGYALGQAIKKVLQATGRDKVILVGHSMGGLCAREYLQNPSNWQPDGQHHVAKLMTTGTPHGGSNSSGTFMAQLITNVDESSEAVRDLRTSYFYSSAAGVYLFGGQETSDVINDNLFGFYCYDVNCNGSTPNQVVGLNQKAISQDLDYACIVSSWIFNPAFGCGDGIVGCDQANLKNYKDVLSETFNLSDSHTSLTENIKSLYEGFDEPDFYQLSYGIETNTSYNAFITKQGVDATFPTDYDDFVFTLTQPGKVKVHVVGAPIFPFAVSILDADYNYVSDQSYNSGEFYTQELAFQPGTYYLETYANPTETSWQFPYAFNVSFTPLNPSATATEIATVEMTASPNPSSDFVNLKVATEKSGNGQLTITNAVGQQLLTLPITNGQFDQQISVSDFPIGLYFAKAILPDGERTIKLVKQ